MKRREFLRASATGAMASTLAAPALAQSPVKIQWRLQSSYPKAMAVYRVADRFADIVREATDGQFDIQTYGAGELVPPLAVLDAVQENTVEMGVSAGGFYIGKDKSYSFACTLPFGLNERLHTAWLEGGGGREILDPFFEERNMRFFQIGDTGAQMGGWFRKELKSLDDFKGIKFRIPGLGGSILQRVGVIPQGIPPSDIYPSLERDTIDAAEMVAPADDISLGLSKVAPYYYFPGFWEGNASLMLIVNNEQWNSLPEHFKAVVGPAATQAGSDLMVEYDVENSKALRKLVEQGTKLRPFPGDFVQACYVAANELFEEYAAENETFSKLLTSYRGFQKETTPWLKIGENTYNSMIVQLMERSK